MIINKGLRCYLSGIKYELEIYNIIKNCVLNGKRFTPLKI